MEVISEEDDGALGMGVEDTMMSGGELKSKQLADEGMTDAESGANIASSIMLRVPTHRLSTLRKEFESSLSGGLDLANFLQSFVKNMDLPSDQALLRIVPDLVDFFNQVDINGDGNMEWSEFVMFVIEQVVSDANFKIDEKMELVSHMHIQAAASRQAVKVSKVFAGISRIFVGVEECIKIYELVEDCPDWLSLNVAIPLSKQLKKEEPVDGEKKRMAKVDEAPIVVLDMALISSKDVLVVLRSDLCFEFFRFSTRAKFSHETVSSLGIKKIDQPLSKLAIRDIPKEPIKIFSIGASKSIRVQTLELNPSGMIELFDDAPLVRHTDYVRDVIVIFTEMHKFVVTCGMDSRVLLWDVYSLNFKASRTGHLAGVECLAYDGKSVLLAGGFDYSVIGWDLDAEIDKPIFHLIGHQGTVMKCVGLGQYDRAVSVDNTGELRFWDTSKTNPNDGIDRQIHEVLFIEDKNKSFDVLSASGGKFESVNGIVVAAHGRKQHVYRICDLSIKPSPPVTALISPGLLMLISVHVKEVIFWDIVTGYFQSSLSNVCTASSEILCAILDDRNRKLILGDSLGVVAVYNCLSGVLLKSFPSLPYAIRFMIYTSDKLIIVIAGIGDIYIFDEAKEECDRRCLLRDTKGTENDTIAVAFSRDLGYIATADCTGALYIWSYEFMTLEAVIQDCCGTEIGQLAFLDPFPLLLVTDKANNFTIVLTKPMTDAPMKRKLWRVETIIPVKVKVVVVKSLFDGIGSDATAETTATATNDPSAEVGKKSKVDDSDDYFVPSDEDEDGEEMSTMKPLSRRNMNKFLLQGRDAKSIGVIMEGLDAKKSDEASDSDLINKILLMTKIKEPEDDIYKGLDDESLAMDEASVTTTTATDATLSYDPVAKSTDTDAAGGVPTGMRCLIQLGFEDGYMAVFDLTPALVSINLPPLKEKEKAWNQERFDVRRTCSKAPKAGEFSAVTWTQKQTSGKNEGFANCHLRKVWKAHNSNVNSLNLVGNHDAHQVITTSDDYSIKMWDYKEGMQKAVLTRGKDLDKLIRPRWHSPIDMEERDKRRTREATIFVEQLNLKRVFIPMPKDGMIFGRTEKTVVAKNLLRHGSETTFRSDKGPLLSSDKGKPLLLSASTGNLNEGHGGLTTAPSSNSLTSDKATHMHNKSGGQTLGKAQSSTELMNSTTGRSKKEGSLVSSGSRNLRETKYSIDESEPAVSRTIGQLVGRITYHMSNKEITKAELAEKDELKKQNELSKTKRSKKKVDVNGDPIVVKSEEAKYLDELMAGDYSLKKKKDDSKSSRLDELVHPSKERKIRTKYDMDLEQLDASDPTNWEIQSINRQRALYPDLYYMLDKNGFTKDLVAMIQDRLNELSPNRDFAAFVHMIRSERSRAKKMFKPEVIESSQTLELSAENLRMMIIKEKEAERAALFAPTHEIVPTLDLAKIESDRLAAEEADRLRRIEAEEAAAAAATAFVSRRNAPPLNPRDEGKPWFGPFVCSKPIIAKDKDKEKDVTTEDPGEVIIRSRDALPLLEKAVIANSHPVHPFKTSQPVELAVHEIIQSKSLPDISKFHTKREYDEIRNMVVNTSYSSLLPVPRNLRLIDDKALVGEREERQVVVEAFLNEIKDIEKVAKKSNRQRKKDRRTVRKIFREHEALAESKIHLDPAETAEFKTTLENLMPRHRAVKLSFDNVESLDDLIHVGRIQESIDAHLQKKLQFARKSYESLMAKVENPNANPAMMQEEKELQKKRAKSKIQRDKEEMNKAMNIEEAKKREDHRILSLHEFGPYKASELMKLHAMISDPGYPKKVVVVKESAEKQLEETMRLIEQERLEEEEALKLARAAAAAEEEEEEDDYDNGSQDGEPKGESGAMSPGSNSRPNTTSSSNEEKRPDSSSTKVANKNDWSIAEKTMEMVSLSKLLETSYVKSRPGFKKDLNSYLNKRADGIIVLRHHVFVTFEEIISHMCPFMTGKVRKDFFRYVELKTYVAPKEVKQQEDGISSENLDRLKILFNFFDLDKSGGVDVHEIMIGLKKAGSSQGSGGLEINQDAIKEMMGSVDAGSELSFEQFVHLFKNVL